MLPPVTVPTGRQASQCSSRSCASDKTTKDVPLNHGGATTTGPDATYPPAICQYSGGGGAGGSCGGGRLGGVGGISAGGGGPKGGLRATHYYHMHTSWGGRVSGGWGVRRYVCDNSAFSSLPRRKS